jgi:NAD(P)-dependent dehydrogenase (short-subunit alcohol dehydrogenase family)
MSEKRYTIAVLGGTGNEGTGIALRLAKAGHKIILGSRDAEKAAQVAAELSGLLGGKFVEQYRPKMGPGIRERIEFSSKVTRRDVDAAKPLHEETRAHIRSEASRGTILALPSAPCVAPLTGLSPQMLENLRARINAAHLHLRSEQTSSGQYSRRNRAWLSRGGFIHRMGGRRRSTARPGVRSLKVLRNRGMRKKRAFPTGSLV